MKFFLPVLLFLAVTAQAQIKEEMLMEISSPQFINGADIPAQFTCDGKNVSPPLIFGRIPEIAKSLVLIVDDIDAPKGTFTHWLVWDIPPDVTELREGSVPTGAVEGKNDFRKTGYGGPCPPAGVHRYYFRVYALKSKLGPIAGASRAALESAMEGHVVQQAELMGKYAKAEASR
jgi:Raf kinase inhibitor-like YbhB/YbcL family protein